VKTSGRRGSRVLAIWLVGALALAAATSQGRAATHGAPLLALAFERIELPSATGKSFTSVTVGPDRYLYAGTLVGEIVRWPIHPDGTLGPGQVVTSLRVANGGDRVLIGLCFDPSAAVDDLVLWATHTGDGFSDGPEWTGKLTRLRGRDLEEVQDYLVHLPRSTRDHLTNQIDFGPDGALYFTQGSASAMGAPDGAWGMRPERLLNAAVLRLDLRLLQSIPLDVATDEAGTYDPWAPGAPLTIYASGVRNAYDLVWHRNGQLYVPTNGSAAGGATPASPDPVSCARRVDRDTFGAYTGPVVPGIARVDQIQHDYLFRVVPGGYYGHPNPDRCEWVLNGGNPTAGADVAEVPQYPVGTQPDRNWRGAAFDFGMNQSPNGIIEYRGGALGGALDGKLLVVRYSRGSDVVVLSPDSQGDIADLWYGIPGLDSFRGPLDLAEDIQTGFIYLAELGAERLTLLRPSS